MGCDMVVRANGREGNVERRRSVFAVGHQSKLILVNVRR